MNNVEVDWVYFQKRYTIDLRKAHYAIIFTINNTNKWRHDEFECVRRIEYANHIEFFFTILSQHEFRKYLIQFAKRSKLMGMDELIEAVPKLKNSTLTVLAFIAKRQKTG